jgi:hypothetical protein
MEYFLRLGTLGECPTLTIDSERFSLLKSSRHILSEALAIEEEYEMVISNYIDLEKESMSVSISYMTRNYRGYVDSFDARLALNRRFMNLLTSVRLYTDKLASHCVACLPTENGVKERVNLLFSTEYDRTFDYRFMDALRNYIQHYGTAVHGVTFGGRWTSLDDKGLLEFTSSFTAEKKYIASDGHFKKQVLDEMPEKVDLISASRGFIEALSAIHINARQMISKSIHGARALIQAAIDDYKSAYKKDFVGLTAYMFDGDTKMDEVLVFLNWDDIRLELEKRNRQLVNLKKRYATGQVTNK